MSDRSQYFRPLNPTGRWMIKTIDDEQTLFVEHKGWIFKRWIGENAIVIRNEESFINECSTTVKGFM